jgi:hypothetical protein
MITSVIFCEIQNTSVATTIQRLYSYLQYKGYKSALSLSFSLSLSSIHNN